MSAVETALLRVGAAITKAAAQGWLRDRKAAEERRLSLVQLAQARGLGLLPQRRLSRQFDQLAETIAERLEPLTTTELRNIDEHERVAALMAVARVLEEADLNDDRVLGADVSAAAVERLVRPAAGSVLDDVQLSEAGTRFFELVLHESIAYLTEVVSTLPSFQNRALRELLERDTEIIDHLREILDRMPRRGVTSLMTSSAEFELEYQREVARKLDQTELFGVTLSGPSRRHRLSVAYIGLSVSVDLDVPDELSVDDALSGSHRVLIRGEAGSGKTTLLQWLAVRCAQGTFDSTLASWNNLIPFFVQLRKFADRDLPSPGELLSNVAWQLKDRMPPGWAYEVLASGRGLLLVDGVDEVSQRQRGSVREWLADLAGAFPRCRYVVTSRPPAVSDQWLEQDGYLIADLQPMSPARTRSFIRHWHEAAAADRPDEELREIETYEAALVAAIDASQALRNLTTNPLLCALVCALNFDRRTQLPRGRMELYDTALEMLLSRRDIERRIPGADDTAVSLSLSEKRLLLEDLAHWFTINELTIADSSRLVKRVRECLRSMPSRELDAEVVFKNLLLRSGLLREHSAGQVDFLHKTFQEYLAAKRIIDTDSVEMLLERSLKDTYREVIVMAVGHCRPHEREKLLKGLLDRSAETGIVECEKLKMLAVSCLETATQLDPVLHRRIIDCLRQLIPPESFREAQNLAVVGKDVLPMLRFTESWRYEQSAAAIRTAGLVGGPEAIPVLAEWARNVRDPSEESELVRAWSYFDPEDYARRVLSEARLPSLAVTDTRVLRGIAELPDLAELHCRFRGVVKLPDLELLATIPELASLDLFDNPEIRDLGWLRNHPRLRHLGLTNCPALKDIAAVVTLPKLKRLWLESCSVHEIETVLSCQSLVDVDIENVTAAEVTRVLEAHPHLESLHVRRCDTVRQLVDLGSHYAVKELSFDACRELTSLAGGDQFPDLERLYFSDCPSLRVLDELRSTSLKGLKLSWCPDIRSLGGLASSWQLEVVTLAGLNIRDLSPLAELRNLKAVRIEDCEWVDDLRPLADLPALRYLSVSRTGVRLDLNPLRGKENLEIRHSGNVINADCLGANSQVIQVFG